MLALSCALTTGVDITYPGNTISIGKVELDSNQATFHSGSDTLGNNSVGPHKCACNSDYEMEYFFGSTVLNCSLLRLTQEG